MYTYLDLTPLGRQEDLEQPPGRSDGPFMSWVRRHDEYDRAGDEPGVAWFDITARDATTSRAFTASSSVGR